MNWVTVSKRGSLLLVGLLAAAACADDESSTDTRPESQEKADGGSTTVDGAVPDAGDSDSGEHDASDDGDAAIPTCSKEGWCRLALPTDPVKTTLVGVWGDGTGIVWAISKEGNILRWDGTSWSVARTGTDRLYAIWGSGPTDLWVTGEAGILHGTGASSASLTWSLEPLASLPGDPTTIFGSVGGTSPTNIWVAGYRDHIVSGERLFVSRVLRYLGPGTDPAWALETDLSTGDILPPAAHTGLQWTKVIGTSSGDVYLVGRSQGSSPDPTVTFTVSVKRRIVQEDGTVVWNEMYNTITPDWNTPGPCRNFVLFAGLWGDDLRDWSPMAAGARGNRVWLTGGVNAERYAIGTFETTTSSTAWTCDQFGVGDAILRNALWVSGENEAWSVGNFGRINHFDGTTWKTAAVTPTTSPTTEDLLDIWGDDHALWVVGKGIALRKVPNR